MKNAIVKLGFCLLFFSTAISAYAANPVPTVTRVGAATQRSAAGQVSFTVTFDVDVTDFDDLPGDVALSGAGAAGATVTSITPVSAKVYTVLVSGLTISGTVKLSVPAGVTNGNDASSGEETISFDGNPAPVFSHPGQDDPTSGSRVIKYTVDFGEVIDGTTFTESDISFAGTDAAFGTLTVDAGSLTATTPNQVYTFTVTISGLPTINKHIIVSLPASKVKDSYGNDNNASTGDGDVTWAGTYPNLAKPTATFGLPPSNIDKINIQGNVVDGGGRTITERGTVWSNTSPVGPNDHSFASGSGTGTFNVDRDNNIDAHMKVYYAIYAENGLGGRVLSEQNFIWTLDDEPAMNGDITNANSTSATNIDLTFVAKGSNADGLVILRKSGSSGYTAADLLQGRKPEDQPGYIMKITGAGTTSYSDGTVAAGQTYTYVVVPYNVYLTQDSTTHYKQSFNSKTETTQSAVSRIVEKNAAAATLAYETKQGSTIASASDGLVLADLVLHDGNAPADDPDTKATELATLKIRIDHPTNVNHVGLLVGSTVVGEGTLDGAGEITFTIPNGAIQVADNDDNGKQFQIIANFKSTVTDGDQLKVTIVNATVTSSSSGLVSATAGGYVTPAGKNAIAVVASTIEFTGTPTAVNVNQDFGFTATLKDALGNIDTNIGGDMTLSATGLTGSLTKPVGSNGQSVWGATDLKFTSAGNKTVNVDVTNWAGAVNGSFTVSSASLGVEILFNNIQTNNSNAVDTLCIGDAGTNADAASYITLKTIKIRESDVADFHIGTNQTFGLQLPAGFIFNTTVAPTLTPAGNEISNLTFTGFSTNKDIVRFKYDISGNSNATKDEITISGLKVKYIGSGAAPAVAILRVGGTAVQEKNADEDERPLGRLAANNLVRVSFKISSSQYNEAETHFSKGTTSLITLVGLDAGNNEIAGSFAGAGVTLDGDGNYKFNPSGLAPGFYNVTFTFTDPTAPYCKSSATKQFEVYTSVVLGLNLQYCSYDTKSQLTGYANFNGYDYCLVTYNDPLLGYSYSYYEYNANAYGPYATDGSEVNPYVWRDYLGVVRDIPKAADGKYYFDPADPVYAATLAYYKQYTGDNSGIVEVGYRKKQLCSQVFYGNQYTFGQVKVYDRPVIDFAPNLGNTGAKPLGTGICATDVEVNLTSDQLDGTQVYDDMWASQFGNPGSTITGAVTGDRVSGFKFDPKIVNPSATTDMHIQINFKHRDKVSQCVNQISHDFWVWKKPSVVPDANILIKGSSTTAGEFCEGENVTNFSATNDGTKTFQWYKDGDLNPSTIGDLFFPSNYLPVQGNGTYDFVKTKFNITQVEHRLGSFYGCESSKKDITVEVFKLPTMQITNAVTICQGNDVIFSTLGATLKMPDGSNFNGKWLKPDYATFPGGQFKNAANNEDSVFSSSVRYEPTNAEWSSGSISLILRPDDPVGPCVSKDIKTTVSVSPGAKVEFPTGPFYQCASKTEMPVDVAVTGTNDFEWFVSAANGQMDASTKKKATAIFNPATSVRQLGGDVVLTVETIDPDGPGPCLKATGDVHLYVSQEAKIDAGPDISICTESTAINIDLNGVIPSNSSATTFKWTKIGGNNLSVGTIGDVNSLVTTYDPDDGTEDVGLVSVQTDQKLTFRLTAYPPSSSACYTTDFFDDVEVTIKGRPVAPTPPNEAVYCKGATIDFLKTETVDIPKWYDDISGSSPSPVSTSKSFATSVDKNIVQSVPFWLTQTFSGCESDFAKTGIIINPLPVPDFTYANQCIGQVMQFTDGSYITTPSFGPTRTISSYEWNFDDEFGTTGAGPGNTSIVNTQGGQTSGTYANPGHKYTRTGEFSVSLTLVSSDGCSATKTIPTIKVGPVPAPDFTSAKLCADDATAFTSTTGLPVGTPVTYSWTFGDAASGASNVSSATNPSHVFSGVGTYPVTLLLTTDLQCKEHKTVNTSIYPYVKTFPYIENFESANHGWVPEGKVFNGSEVDSLTSWGLFTAAGEITADPLPFAGANFWAAHTDLGDERFYYDNERSVLNGPCVDMTGLSRPVIAMDYFNDTEPKSDGAYIEYRVEDSNGNGTWTRLGDNSSGLDWYSEGSIGGLSLLGNLGQNLGQFGWSDTTQVWKTGRYNLDPLASASRIRFRVVFGSNISPVNTARYDGFALDNFKLESRNRLVLVESFTTDGASGAVANRDAFQLFPSASASSEVVKIEYHPSLSAQSSDAISKQNMMDPNARASYYGVSSVPRAYIDGFSDANSGGMFSGSTWAAKYYSTESLKTSPIDIDIQTPVVTDGLMTVSGSITARETELPGNKYTLYVAVVEEEVGDNKYVLRKMLPSASGIKISATAQGATFNFSETWNLDKSYFGSDEPKLIAVAFVQSDIPNMDGERTVLQAAYNDNTPVISYTTGIETPFLQQTAMYPNPADRIVNIELPHATQSGVDVSVLDQLGREVTRSFIGVGLKSTSINTSDLSGAIYMVQLRENGVITTRRLLVTHNHR